MNPQQSNPAPQSQIHNPLSVMQPGEQIICEIKRHPIGILGIYLTCGFLIVVLAVLALLVVPAVIGGDHKSAVTGIGAAVFIVLAALMLVFVFISNKVYWGNSWVVSSDSLTQILQVSLFDRKSSQLSLGNLEDVTAEQNGVIAHLFHFGTLRVETAGERSKFVFPYCPNPNYYAQKILAAREAFEQYRRDSQVQGSPQRLYREEGAYQQPPPPPAVSEPDSPPPQPQPAAASQQIAEQPPIFPNQPFPSQPTDETTPPPPVSPPEQTGGSPQYPTGDEPGVSVDLR